MTNLRRIKKGDTWVWQLKFWDDPEKTVAVDVSGHTFSFTAVSAAGTNVITLSDASFVETDSNHRTVTISANTTATYAAGELKYQLDVTLPDATVETWMEGYVNVEA
jgi:hypothetical protein